MSDIYTCPTPKSIKASLAPRAGFTIIELLVVVVVIAILATITLVVYNGVVAKAKDASLAADLQTLEEKVQVSAATGNGGYDPSLNWNSNDGADAALNNFQPSNGAHMIVSVSDDGSSYCIRAYSAGSTYGSLANSLTKGDCAINLISSGSYHTCAVAGQDAVYCWGANFKGQIGNNSTAFANVPTKTTGTLNSKEIRIIVGGYEHSCAVSWDNLAYCWGDNSFGQLGNGTTVSVSSPTAITMSGALAGKTIRSLYAGVKSSCAVASDGKAYCWGLNDGGQLGNNSTTNSVSPVAVYANGSLAGKTIKSVAIGLEHACAIASDNNIYCWGLNDGGQLGNGTVNDSTFVQTTPAPIAMGPISGKTPLAIVASNSHTCTLVAGGEVYCWGQGYMGNGGTNGTAPTPVAITRTGAMSGKSVKSVSASSSGACVIASDDQAYCWGIGDSGQLGNNATTSSAVPVAVYTGGALAGKTIKAVSAASGATTCALASDGNAYCWGANVTSDPSDYSDYPTDYYGLLGTASSVTQSSVPVKVSLPQN